MIEYEPIMLLSTIFQLFMAVNFIYWKTDDFYREVSVLISCIASIYHVYMKFTLKIKDSTFFWNHHINMIDRGYTRY
jgi:hypothetical protein